ncbi:MAG TPA: AhpC/TSA family protein, partial [Methylomirabilota bacterium]|nr:AhpC/TSA family protein [Methylomirabilota bacterium]
MSLKDELRVLRERLEASRPPETVAAMHRAVEELRASGAAAGVRKVGEVAPDFRLPGAHGRLVDSRHLRAEGPLVVT